MRWHPGHAAQEKFAAVQMIDVHRPTTDGRELVHPLYRARTRAQPAAEQAGTGATRPTTPKNHCRSRFSDPAVVPTFRGRLQRSQILRSLKVLQSAKLG